MAQQRPGAFTDSPVLGFAREARRKRRRRRHQPDPNAGKVVIRLAPGVSLPGKGR